MSSLIEIDQHAKVKSLDVTRAEFSENIGEKKVEVEITEQAVLDDTSPIHYHLRNIWWRIACVLCGCFQIMSLVSSVY